MNNHIIIIFKFFFVAAAIIVFPAFLSLTLESDQKSNNLIGELEKKFPSYVFIGNSMLETRIDNSMLEDITGKNSFLIHHGGIMSSVYYLIFKNTVCKASIQPDTAFIFFRNTHLTEPLYRTRGKYSEKAQWYKSKHEPVFDSLLTTEEKDQNWIKKFLAEFYPLNAFKYRASNFVSSLAAKATGLLSLVAFEKFDREQINQLFKIANFRPVETDGENTDQYLWNYDFHNALQKSFLPHIVALSKIKKINLCLVRVQKRPKQRKLQKPNKALAQYMKDLRWYIEDQGYTLIDLNGDPRISIEMYGSGDHINKLSKKKYTLIFSEMIKDLYK